MLGKNKKLPKYLVLHKKRGETPLDLLKELKASRPELANVPLSYAGRLDPMAEGKMLVLVGDECKKQSHYTGLDKEYEVAILLGAKTDTGDLLGIVEGKNLDKTLQKELDKEKTIDKAKNSAEPQNIYNVYILRNLQKAIRKELGSHSRRYPAFSSKTINGKPLFLYALEGRLKEIQIPEHIETIYKIRLIASPEEISADKLQKKIYKALAVVPRSDEPSKELGQDFRQDAVRACWDEFFKQHVEDRIEDTDGAGMLTFLLVHMRVTCGSGAYMRTLAERIGETLGVPALAFSINRTKMGRFFRIGPLGFWRKNY